MPVVRTSSQPSFGARTGLPGDRHLLEQENKGDGGSGGTPPKPPAPAVLDDAAKAKLADYDTAKAKLAEYEKADQEREAKRLERAEAEKKKLADEGKHKELLEAQSKDLEATKKRLAELEADAKLGASARATHQKAIAEGKAKLSPEQKALVETMEKVDVVQAAQLVAHFAGNTKPSPPGIGGGPPPPPGSETLTVEALQAQGMELADIKAKHPALWDDFIKKQAATSAAKSKGRGIGAAFLRMVS